MRKTPKSLRLQIGIFGRTNVGKSSFLNLVAGQDVAITSPIAGTTTDVVEKTMELLPVGPVVFLDTAGIDDTSELSGARLKKSRKIFDRADVIILVTEPDVWAGYEEEIVKEAGQRNVPVIVAVNKIDLRLPGEKFLSVLKERTPRIVQCSSIDMRGRDACVNPLKKYLLEVCPDGFLNPPPLIGDLVPRAGLAVLIVPIDLEAPKGRIILPQVQAIRDALDNNAGVLVVKEREYAQILKKLRVPPDIVVCDSQVVHKMTADTPTEVRCTTFSILFSRYKGDLLEAVRSVKAVDGLRSGDRILIAEGCSHHAIEDDIGRVKIPRWLKEYTGVDVKIDVCAGRDYPDDLRAYKLIVHCGACMLTRREMLFRIQRAKEAGAPLTNYGVCVSYIQGVLGRTLSPFPAALELFQSSRRHS
jgi:[FeFe] hydrogenase H-cluster maturation GTPase HydF